MYRFGPFEVDFATSELRKNGSLVRIQEQPLRILQSLLEQPGELTSREQLKEHLWPSDTFVDFERSLNAGVAKLRQALNDSSDQPVYVETLARKGYRFIAPVTRAPEPPPQPQAPASRRFANRRVLAFLAIAAGLITAAILLSSWLRTRPSEANGNDVGAHRFTITLPESAEIADAPYVMNMAVSPDGRVVAIVVSEKAGPKSIWLRPLASETPHRLDGTEGASLPFWSPDSKDISFFAHGELKRISASGGTVRSLCKSIPSGFGGTWGSTGVILYSAGTNIRKVDAGGGPCTDVTQLTDAAEFRHAWPDFLPDGRRFTYFAATADPSKAATYLASLDSGERQLLLVNRNRTAFAAPDKLIFVQDNTLFVQSWDLRSGKSRGHPAPLAANINSFPIGQSAFSVSANGTLVYRTGANVRSQIVVYSRDGKRLTTIGPPGLFRQLTLSPDEKTFALSVVIPPKVTASRIWLLRADTQVMSQLDFGHAVNSDPVWSPDSHELIFSAFEVDSQKSDLYRWAIGDFIPKLLISDGKSNKPDHWSRGGQTLVYRRDDRLVFSLAPAPGSKPAATGDSEFGKDQLQLSPDSSLVAYNGSRAGVRDEVFVTSFPSFRGTIQVSSQGGVQPVWNTTGTSLYYLAPDGSLMSVDIRRDPTVEAGTPKRLFQTRAKSVYWGSQYAVSSDGQKVYLLESIPSLEDTLHVIANWHAAPGR